MTQNVSWPTWKELQSNALIVVVASVIFALLVFVMDNSLAKQIAEQLEKKNVIVCLVSDERKLTKELDQADPELILIQLNAPTGRPLDQIVAQVFAWMRLRARAINKFLDTQKLLSTPEILERITFEVCEDAYLKEGIRILELRYAPTFVQLGHDLSFEQIHEAIVKGDKAADLINKLLNAMAELASNLTSATGIGVGTVTEPSINMAGATLQGKVQEMQGMVEGIKSKVSFTA